MPGKVIRGRINVAHISIILLLALTMLLATVGPASADSPAGGNSINVRLRATDKALAWLAALQNEDGGFGSAGSSDWLSTALAVQAYLLRGEDAATLTSATGKSAADYLTANVAAIDSDSYKVAQMILAGVALGEDPTTFAGRNWLTWLDGTYQPNGQYASGSAGAVEAQVAAFMALRAGYQPVPAQASAWLKDAAQADGGWGATETSPSDTYHTGLALWASMLAGEPADSDVVQDAVAYLAERQAADGGFAAVGETDPDIFSTSAAILGLTAAGENLLDAPWMAGDWSPFDALLAMQSSDGAFISPNTEQKEIAAMLAGIRGLIGRPEPLRQRLVASGRAVEWLHTQQCHTNPGCDEEMFGPGSFGPGSTTTDAIVAIAAVGQDPDGDAWTLSGQSALRALEELTPAYVDRPGNRSAEAAKTAMAAMAAGRDPRAFGGLDLIAHIESCYNPETGRYYDTWLYRHNLAVLGLNMAGATLPDAARLTLVDEQHDSGGWGWAFESTVADVDSTGLTMRTLAEIDHPLGSATYSNASDFLAGLQFDDGTLPDRAGVLVGNSNSTALAARGLLASGRDPRDEPFVRMTSEGSLASMVDALLAFQENSGAFVFTMAIPESRLLAVLDTVPALVADFPPYEPLSEALTTDAGQAQLWQRSDGIILVAPFAGDGNDNGTLQVRKWDSLEGSWSEPLAVSKTAVSYLASLGATMNVTLKVEFLDADGVEGTAVQTVHLRHVVLPLIAKT